MVPDSYVIQKTLAERGLLDKKVCETVVNLLARMTHSVEDGLNLDAIMDDVYDSFKELFPLSRMGLGLLVDDRKTIRSFWNHSDSPIIHITKGYEAPLKGSSLERVLEKNKPRIINDLREYLVLHPNSASTKMIVAEGIQSSLTCPLIIDEKAIGFLFFSSINKNSYKNAHVSLFEAIALQVTSILDKLCQRHKLYID